MGWQLSLRNRRGLLVAALLFTVCTTKPGRGVNDPPGDDETIFDPIVIEQPKPLQERQKEGGEKR